MRRVTTLIAGLLLASCATEELRPDYERARSLIRATTGQEAVHDPEAPTLPAEEIEALLADGLGLDEALRLALINNRRFQAGFQELGIARADAVQAGLLTNPTLDLFLLFPAGDGGRNNVGGTFAMGLSELWQRPERRALAAADEERVLLELGQLAGRLVADTRGAYARAVAARELAGAAREAAELAARSAAAVQLQVDRGVADELQAQAARGDSLAAESAARAARREQSQAVRRLAALLSLTGDLEAVSLVDPLPVAPGAVPDRETLVAHAVATRLDLRAAREAVAAAQAGLALEHERAFPELEVGVGYDRPESDDPTDHLAGPVLGVELPVFDRNQAGIRRAEHELEQRRRELEALESEARQQVRAAADAVSLAADDARFRQERSLPQAERSAALLRESYRRGSTTLLPLLEAERALARARAEGIAGALELALAQAALEQALGGPWPPRLLRH